MKTSINLLQNQTQIDITNTYIHIVNKYFTRKSCNKIKYRWHFYVHLVISTNNITNLFNYHNDNKPKQTQ